MNAPEPVAHLQRTAIDGAQYLPLNLCQPGAYNPRKRIDDKALGELADNIEKVGVMQPVVARLIEGAKRGAPLYEIVVGQRRLLACRKVAERRKESDIAVIPALVRELSDFDARELASIENLQRQDLHPLEEAEGFENLLLRPVAGGEFNPPRAHGHTVKQLAERFGKSEEYVFTSLKLLALIPKAREAFFADKITKSVAILIARMPASVQPDALKEIVDGWAGDPLPFRQASETLQQKFMLKLASAPFKITDETLVPGAGNCKECPKRSGAAPDLFNDVKGADVCTDAACFQSKKDAHQARLIEQAKAEGREVIMGAAAKKVKPHQYSSSLVGYVPLDKVEYSIPGAKTMKQHLGKDSPPVALLEDPHTHELVPVVKADAAMKVLRDKGVIKTAKLGGRSDAERKAEEKAKAEVAWRNEVARRCMAEAVDPKYDDADLHSWLLPELAVAAWHRLDHETTKRAVKLLGWEEVKGDIDAHIRKLDARHLDQALIAIAIAGQLHVSSWDASGNRPTRLLQIAGRLGVDAPKVRAELDAASKTKAKAKTTAAKTPAAKKATAGKAPAVRYRDPATGSTWSGRGLQPAWLKAALAGGKTLAEFDTTVPSSADPEPEGVAKSGGKGAKPKTKTKPAAFPPTSEEKNEPAAAKAAGKPKTKQKDEAPAGAGAVATDSSVSAPTKPWPFPSEPPEGFHSTSKPPKRAVAVVSAAAAWPFPTGEQA